MEKSSNTKEVGGIVRDFWQRQTDVLERRRAVNEFVIMLLHVCDNRMSITRNEIADVMDEYAARHPMIGEPSWELEDC